MKRKALHTDPPAGKLRAAHLDCDYPRRDATAVPLYDTVSVQSGSGFPVADFSQPSALPRYVEAIEAIELAAETRRRSLERW